jgi:hypothetical protein
MSTHNNSAIGKAIPVMGKRVTTANCFIPQVKLADRKHMPCVCEKKGLKVCEGCNGLHCYYSKPGCLASWQLLQLCELRYC